MKAIKFYIYAVWYTPTLFLHEVAHAFMQLVLGGGMSTIKFEFSLKDGRIEGTCCRSSFLSKKDALVSIAPIIVPVITILLLIVNFNVFGIILLYQLSTIKVLLPSKHDIDCAKKTLKDPFWSLTEP